MRYFEVEGPNPEEALNNFLNEKRYPKEFITNETIDAGKKGFLGFGKKNALIKIVFNDIDYVKRKSKLILSDILEKAGFENFHIEVKEFHSDYILNIESPDSSLLIGKMAQTLDSLQFIMDKMLGRDATSNINVIIDVESYRYRVVKHLKEKAARLSNKVRKTGKAEKLSPMVTIIRKDIHMAIKKIPGVKSESNGSGNIKTLFIVPDKGHRNHKRKQTTSKK